MYVSHREKEREYIVMVVHYVLKPNNAMRLEED